MFATAEILNDAMLMAAVVGLGVLLVTVGLALAVHALRRATRRVLDGRSSAQVCRAFAEAVARGDMEVAEVVATLAFAGDVGDWSGVSLTRER